MFKEILSSASKVVFVLLTIATCVGLFTKVIDPKDFIMLTAMAFSFYFSNKGETANYAGK